MRILSFCLVFLLISCKATYPKVDLNAISEKEKQQVYDFGKKILETCDTGKFLQFSGRKVATGLNELSSKQMQDACAVLAKRNGKFIDMELIEVIDDTQAKSGMIYRYKARFERNDFLNEVRIWRGSDGKFQGIIWQEWKDEYIPYKK